MDHIWLALSWIAYFVVHSILALMPVKDYFRNRGISDQKYRFIYVVIATIGFLAIIIFSATIETHHIFQPSKLIKFVGLLIAVQGFWIAKVGFRSYDTKAFLGLGSLKPEDEFKTDGLLKRVRHPLYAGSIMLVVGYFFFDPKLTSLISTSLVILYFIVGIYLEEQKLVKVFGDRYIEYRKKTPMLIPRFWEKSR